MPELTKVQTGFLEGQGQFELDPGTEAAPGVTFGDSSTGLYKSATDEVAVSISGTQKVKFTSTGVTGNLTGNVTGNLTGNVTGESIIQNISSEIADTAVDIFIYDTSKDSDGGAWRQRTTHTSWYNETLNTATRGSRREFPAVAVIVATSSRVTIYDGDDPDLPMWMVFNSGGYTAFTTSTISGNTSLVYPISLTSVFALNGTLAIGATNYQVYLPNFISDVNVLQIGAFGSYTGGFALYSHPISGRNSSGVYTRYSTEKILASNVNDVAMTVLPNAPIDNVTQLPRPTILIGQKGGLSIIKDDYTVLGRVATWVDGNGGGVWEVQFDEKHGGYWYSTAYYAETNGSYPNHGLSVAYESNLNETNELVNSAANHQTKINLSQGTAVSYLPGGFWNGSHIPDFWFPSSLSANGGKVTFTNQGEYFGTQFGLTLFDADYNTIGSTTRNSLGAYITSTYNTGWMHSEIRAAFSPDINSSNNSTEYLTNNTFDTDTTGWTGDAYTTTSVTSGIVHIEQNSGTTAGISQAVTTEVGKRYIVSGRIQTRTGSNYGGGFYVGSGHKIGDLAFIRNFKSQGGFKIVSLSFVATATTTYITLVSWGGTGDWVEFDYVSMRESEVNRTAYGSIQNDVVSHDLIPFGTITKSPVAPGAELLAYSGFSSNNELKTADNVIQYGTNNFYVSFWYKRVSGSEINIWGDFPEDGSSSGWRIVPGNVANDIYIVNGNFSNYAVFQGKAKVGGVWAHMVFTREYNVGWKAYQDGILVGTTSAFATTNYNAGGKFEISGAPDAGNQIALIRTGFAVPSLNQIKKMFEDEKPMFNDNAACTLYGGSDGVTALAYDEVTERLHVGTSSGRSEFQGLRRINNTTTAVTTAISAYDSFVVEQ